MKFQFGIKDKNLYLVKNTDSINQSLNCMYF